jgi:hypothetical protein
MNSNCVALYQFTPLKRTKNNELAVLDVYNLVIERYFILLVYKENKCYFRLTH